MCPNASYDGVWDSIIVDPLIKEQLLSYAESVLLFAQHDVDTSLISSNKVRPDELYGGNRHPALIAVHPVSDDHSAWA
jgi:hypothetical protein